MANLIKAAVIEKDVLESFIQDGYCTSIDDLSFDDATGFDYAQTALIDNDINKILYWEDNIHGNPDDYISAFTDALIHYGIEYSIIEKVYKYDDLKKLSGQRYR